MISQKRLFSFFLAVLMVLTCFPKQFAKAEENIHELKTNTKSYDYYGTTFQVTSASSLPESGEVEFTDIESGDIYNEIGTLLKEKYDGVSTYQVSKFRIKDSDSGTYVDLSGATVEVSDMLYMDSIPYVFSYADGVLTKLESTQTKDPESGFFYYGYTTESLDCIVTVSPTGLTEREPDTGGEFEPGTYTVTANLYVDGKDNDVLQDTTAYLTNLKVPPLEPITNNAKLVIAENGEMTLTVQNFNSVFTLQGIENGDGVEIQERILEYVDLGPYQSRINGLVMKLTNTSGQYSFTNCHQYPTILQTDTYMPIQMTVDFASMEPGFDDSVEALTSRVFEDADVGCKVTLTTSETGLIEKITELQLYAREVTDGEAYEEAIRALEDLYTSGTPFKVYQFDILDETGANVTLSGNTQVAYSIATESLHPVVLRIVDGVAVENKFSVATQGQVAFTESCTGLFAVVDTTNGGRIVEFAYESDEISYAFTHVIMEGMNPAYFEGNEAVVPKISTEDGDTTYRFCVKNPFFGGMNGAVRHEGFSSFEVSMTYEEGKYYYLVMDEGVYVSTICLNDKAGTTVTGGAISFDLFDIAGIKDPAAGLNYFYSTICEGLYYGWCNEGEATKDEPFTYILVTSRKIADTPFRLYTNAGTKASKVYNAEEQNIIEDGAIFQGSNNTLTGTVAAKTAGEYTFTATPAEGYTWLDGTNTAKEYTWRIDKEYLQYAYIDEVIRLGETPALKVELVIGSFAGEETEETAENFVLPVVTPPDPLAVGVYELEPQGGSATNYTIRGRSGTLTVLPGDAQIIEKPVAVTGLKENGSVQVGVPEGTGYTVTSNTGTVAGTYTAKVQLQDNYYWPDGTREDLSIQWTIGESGSSGEITPEQPKTETVTANLYLPGENNQILPGVTVYLNNANNPIQGTGTPTTPLSDNATLKTDADGTMTLTLNIPNPVFTLQAIDGCDNAEILSTKTSDNVLYMGGGSGKRDTRISQIVVELKDRSGEYIFENCVEFPTILNQEWNYPLTLRVNFDGGADSGLDSNPDVDVSGVIGGSETESGSSASLTPSVTAQNGVANVAVSASEIEKVLDEQKDADLSRILITPDVSGTAHTVSVELPKAAVSSVVEKSNAAIVFETDLGTVALSNEVLKSIDDQAAGSNVQISVAEQTVESVEEKLDGHTAVTVVEVTVASDGKNLTSFGGKNLVLTLPVESDKLKDGKVYRVLAISDDGSVEAMTGKCVANSDASTVQIMTSHLTTFVVTGTEISNPFQDVAENAYYADAVLWAVEKGITVGTSSATFSPDHACTRAQAVTFLWRAAGSPEPQSNESPFEDVQADAYYYKAVLWAVEQGITNGTSATAFSPDAVVPRGQMVTFQWRMAGSPESNMSETAFADVAEGSYYAAAVSWAKSMGITNGNGDGFAPNQNCTRAQIVTFLYRQFTAA